MITEDAELPIVRTPTIEIVTRDIHDQVVAEKNVEIERLRAALEQIVRECGALNKGPVAAKIAADALGNG